MTDLDEQYFQGVANDAQKLVYERMRRLAAEHGGAPESLFAHEAWRELVADMSRRMLIPEDYVAEVRAEQEVKAAEARGEI